MGSHGSKRSKEPLDPNNLSMNHFEILRVLGKGAFGKVHAVQRRDTKELFAMKVMDKAQILDEKMVDQVLNERYMMAQLHYPLVVNLRFAAQDQLDLFLVVDLMLGGDLRYHMKPGRCFDENRVRFYAAQTALAINYLHESGYIHRDIKPDNLLLDGQGNVHLTDFNLSVKRNDPRRRGVVGTRSYMAPEVVSRQQYNEMVDWWSLGICVYEWIFGTVPFRGSTEEQKEAILSTEPRYAGNVSKNCKSLLMALLRKNPTKRADFAKIKAHPFFEGLDWLALEQKRADAPWKPDATRANCDGTYDLDEQFQVKRKRPPVTNPCFGTWDWKPGQVSVESPRSGRKTGKSGEEETEPSVESDGAISDERPRSAEVSSDYVEPTNSTRATSESIPSVAEVTGNGKDAATTTRQKNRKSRAPEPVDDGSSSVEDSEEVPASKSKSHGKSNSKDAGKEVPKTSTASKKPAPLPSSSSSDEDDEEDGELSSSSSTTSSEGEDDSDSRGPARAKPSTKPAPASPHTKKKTDTAPITIATPKDAASTAKSSPKGSRKHDSVPATSNSAASTPEDTTAQKLATKKKSSSRKHFSSDLAANGTGSHAGSDADVPAPKKAKTHKTPAAIEVTAPTSPKSRPKAQNGKEDLSDSPASPSTHKKKSTLRKGTTGDDIDA